MNTRTRGYCFTTNNYDDDDIIDATALWAEYNASYVIIGFEQGEKGTHHLQCYAFFPNKITFNTLKTYLPRSHIEVAKGTPEQNFDYCSKEKYIELGELPKSGKRTDLIDMYNEIKQGTPLTDLADKYPSNYLRYSGSIEKAYNLLEKANTECQVIYVNEDPYESCSEILTDSYIMDTLQHELYNYQGEKYIIYFYNPPTDVIRRFVYNIPITVKRGYMIKKQLPELVIIYDPKGYHYKSLSSEKSNEKLLDHIEFGKKILI